MTETDQSKLVAPETLAKDPLEVLQRQFQQEIGGRSQELGFGQKIVERLKSPKVLLPVAAAGTAVVLFTPGFVEGLAKGLNPGEALVYTIASTPISTIWEAAPNIPGIIDGLSKGDLEPMLELVEKYGLAVRATIVPAITSAGLIGGAFALYEKARNLKEGIGRGTVPIERRHPQIFALFGEDSFVGQAFFQTAPENVVPVTEKSEAARGIITGDENKGVYVNLDGQRYIYEDKDKLSPWRRLRFNKNWLLPTEKGEKLLVVIGFGETKDEELPLVTEEMVDLTVEEQALASEQLLAQAKRMGVSPDRIVNIYVGNPERKRLRGTGAGLKQVSDREVAVGTIDIFLNAGGMIIKSLRERIGHNDTITFETGVPAYWDGFRILAKDQGLTVHDENNPDSGNAVVLFYEKQTDETVQSAKDFKKRNPSRRVMVLTSSLASHREAVKSGLESVSVAEILASELSKITGELKEGKTLTKIQTRLDSGLVSD